MGKVSVYTFARMKEIVDNTIVNGAVVNGRLILTKKNGEAFDGGGVGSGSTPTGPSELRSPNGTLFRLLVDNNGLLIASSYTSDSTPTPVVAEPLTSDLAGVNSDLTWGALGTQQITDQVTKMSLSGVRHVRLNISWNMLENSAKGSYNAGNLALYDHAISSLRSAGITILATLGHDVPYWASADPAKSGGTNWHHAWRPGNWSDYGDYCTYVMNRWGSKFSIIQIWNEPNFSQFWPSQATEQARINEYVQMLSMGHSRVKAINPNMPVAHAGLGGGNAYHILHWLYLAGAKPYFDYSCWHPYTNNVSPTLQWTESNRITGSGQVAAKDSFLGMDTCRQVMIDNGDSAKGVVITEWGWTTTTGEGGVSEADQASFLSSGWDLMRARPWIVRSFLYIFREQTYNTGKTGSYGDDWVNKFGITTPTLVDKPARLAFTTKAQS